MRRWNRCWRAVPMPLRTWASEMRMRIFTYDLPMNFLALSSTRPVLLTLAMSRMRLSIWAFASSAFSVALPAAKLLTLSIVAALICFFVFAVAVLPNAIRTEPSETLAAFDLLRCPSETVSSTSCDAWASCFSLSRPLAPEHAR